MAISFIGGGRPVPSTIAKKNFTTCIQDLKHIQCTSLRQELNYGMIATNCIGRHKSKYQTMTLKMESGLLPNISYSILLFMTKVAFLNREEKNTPFFQKKITLESRNAKNINFSS